MILLKLLWALKASSETSETIRLILFCLETKVLWIVFPSVDGDQLINSLANCSYWMWYKLQICRFVKFVTIFNRFLILSAKFKSQIDTSEWITHLVVYLLEAKWL